MIWYQIVGLAFCMSVIWWNVNHLIISLKTQGPMKSQESIMVYLFVTTIFLFFTMILATAIIASTYKIIIN